MTFRRRMVLATTGAVALAVVLCAIAAYLVVGGELNRQVDSNLRQRGEAVARIVEADQSTLKPGMRLRINRDVKTVDARSDQEIALITAAGEIYRTSSDSWTGPRPSDRDLAVARGQAPAVTYDAGSGADAVRVFVTAAGHGRAILVEQGIADLHHSLYLLALTLGLITLGGVLAAGLLGLGAVRIGTVPLRALRHAAEHVGSTGDLSRRIADFGDDDLGRLSVSFNRMLTALEESQRLQQQLIADASHELRTPVASLRTNLEVLLRTARIAPEERTKLTRDLVEQSSELGALVEDLLDSARDGKEDQPVPMRLDLLVDSVVRRTASKHPSTPIETHLRPTVVVGHESRLERAVGNLLDNALKWSPPDRSVEVSVDGGLVTVRDHGPGFVGEDLPFVFDRFFRSESARSVPGSGLGLSIVRKVAREHGAEPIAANAPGGGAVVSLRLRAVTDDPTPELD